jgi:hypothetical protein
VAQRVLHLGQSVERATQLGPPSGGAQPEEGALSGGPHPDRVMTGDGPWRILVMGAKHGPGSSAGQSQRRRSGHTIVEGNR